MKKYRVEYLKNGNEYDVKVFTDYGMAMSFYSRIRKKEWARLS